MTLKQGLLLILVFGGVLACESSNSSNNTGNQKQDGRSKEDSAVATDGSAGGLNAAADSALTSDLGHGGDAIAAVADFGEVVDASGPSDGSVQRPDGRPDVAAGDSALDAGSVIDLGAVLPCNEGDEQPCDEVCPGGYSACRDESWGACLGPAESCNGLDDDCDGQVDEDFPDLDSACIVGIGACARPGRLACNDVGDDVTCDALAGEPSGESCNGQDDDCDGDVDEDFDLGSPCEVGLGECRGVGVIACALDGTGTCDGQPGFPGAERCNGLDDNCDGQVDEDFDLGSACSIGTGACEAHGVRLCGPQGNAICGARAGDPLPEQCNGLDDDCDGQADEDFQTLGAPCSAGTGSCQRFGEFVCNGAGDGVSCSAVAAQPTFEACNDLDDDCDGTVDDSFNLGAACTVGVGACRAAGTLICQRDGTAACSARPGIPLVEICNGIDDDCDALIDENDQGGSLEADCYGGPDGTLNVGICRGGRMRCENGEYGECRQEVLPADELCDTLDNDCDGVVDDGIPGLGEVCGTGRAGRCAAGRLMCSLQGQICAPDAVPIEETCNDLDDDCDGQADNGTGKGDACSAGVGECVRPGHRICNEIGGTTCDAVAGNPAAGDICDGLDNDCNGVTDNGCPLSLSVEPGIDGPRLLLPQGDEEYRSACPPGQVIVGFDIWSSISGVRPVCRGVALSENASVTPRTFTFALGITSRAQFVGSTNLNDSRTFTCPEPQVITGFSGLSDPRVGWGINLLQFNCSSVQLAPGAGGYAASTAFASQSGPYGGFAGNPFQNDCPPNTVATAIHGDINGVVDVDTVGFTCSELAVTTR